MRKILSLLLVCVAVSSAMGGDWWEEELAEQEKAISSGEATHAAVGNVLWAGGYIEVIGEAGCDMEVALSETDCYVSARRAAIVLAQEKLAEMVHGIAVDGETTLRNELLRSSTLRTKTFGLIRGAEICKEDRVRLQDGSILARVWMRLPLHGEGGLGQPVLEHAMAKAVDRPIPVFSFDDKEKEPTCTGIIVDAGNLEAIPAMAPRLLVLEALEAALCVEQVDLEVAAEIGMVAYAADLGQAESLKERIGDHPLVVTAESSHGATGADLVISAAEGERLRAADAAGSLLKNCKVVFAGETFF